MPDAIPIYVEMGTKRVFAGAIDWPGWTRGGRDEDAALAALAAYGPRYRAAMGRAARGFRPPADASGLDVVERLEGSGSTDFGAPAAVPKADDRPLDDAEHRRQSGLLRAAWAALDHAAEAAASAVLRTGPRGGGRDLPRIVSHVAEAEGAYLRGLGGSFRDDPGADQAAAIVALRGAVLDTLRSRARGEPPAPSRRTKAPWSPRYFLRRAIWHVLDHAWEIEDRAGPEPGGSS
jgi:hypothetical protein